MMGNNVLIVDDSPLSIKVYASFLKRKGYRVSNTGSVSEASLIIGKEKIDYIILDYNLAGLNTGRELIRKLKRYNYKVTVYASSSTDNYNRELMEAGCDDIIRPDISDIDRLFDTIQQPENNY